MSVTIRRPRASDETGFLDAVARSKRLHAGWVRPPNSHAGFQKILTRADQPRHVSFFLWEGKCLGGVVNLSEIVRGSFQSAYLGYYAFEPLAGHGLMREGLRKVIVHAFRRMKLHRLEANIQPSNIRSIKLVKALGFRCEGLSPRYLKIAGRWRDHQRWAILNH